VWILDVCIVIFWYIYFIPQFFWDTRRWIKSKSTIRSIRVHKNLTLVHILNQIHPVHNFSPYFRKIPFTIILPSTPRSSALSLPFKFSGKNLVWISYLSHAYYMHCQFHTLWHDQPNNVRWSVQVNVITVREWILFQTQSGIALCIVNRDLTLKPSWSWLSHSNGSFVCVVYAKCIKLVPSREVVSVRVLYALNYLEFNIGLCTESCPENIRSI
jgi:hypothetical protein